MFVKPASDGRKVRDPKTRLHLPEAGAHVPDDDPYWHRRLADGDVVAAQPPSDAKSDKAK